MGPSSSRDIFNGSTVALLTAYCIYRQNSRSRHFCLPLAPSSMACNLTDHLWLSSEQNAWVVQQCGCGSVRTAYSLVEKLFPVTAHHTVNHSLIQQLESIPNMLNRIGMVWRWNSSAWEVAISANCLGISTNSCGMKDMAKQGKRRLQQYYKTLHNTTQFNNHERRWVLFIAHSSHFVSYQLCVMHQYFIHLLCTKIRW